MAKKEECLNDWTQVEGLMPHERDALFELQHKLVAALSVREAIAPLHKILDNFIDDATFVFQKLLDKGEIAYNPNLMESLLHELGMDFKTRLRLAKAYNACTQFYEHWDYVKGKKERQEQAKTFGVTADYVDGFVVVRTPMLASRWSKSQVVEARKARNPGFSKMFSEEVAALMVDIERGLSRAESEAFSDKTVNVFFLYGHNDRIADSDNHDTKSIIDAITREFPFEDSATSCSFSFRTIVTKKIPASTFFVLAKGKNNFITDKTFAELFAKLPDKTLDIIFGQEESV